MTDQTNGAMVLAEPTGLLMDAAEARGRADGVAEERARCLSLCKEFSVPNVAMEIRGGAEGKAER